MPLDPPRNRSAAGPASRRAPRMNEVLSWVMVRRELDGGRGRSARRSGSGNEPINALASFLRTSGRCPVTPPFLRRRQGACNSFAWCLDRAYRARSRGGLHRCSAANYRRPWARARAAHSSGDGPASNWGRSSWMVNQGAFDSVLKCAQGLTCDPSSKLATTRQRRFGSSGWLQIGDAQTPQKWRTEPAGVRNCAGSADAGDQR